MYPRRLERGRGNDGKSEGELESKVEEEDELHAVDHTLDVEYDKDDPPMTEDTTHPNMEKFELALTQHAIKHEFEFNTEYGTPHSI